MPVIDIINNTLAAIGAATVANTEARLRHVIQKLATLGIKANYDPVPAIVDGKLAPAPTRVLLYSSRYNARNFQIASECNGIILDYTTWQVVYRPPELPNAQFSVGRVTENFAEYDIFDLNDGTVVGLYHYQDKWHIATARGIDMGAVTWCGVTYQAAIEEAMAHAKFPTPADQAAAAAGEIDAAPARALKWSELDTDVSYTLGFTHPKMHFSQFTGMWLIRARQTNSTDDEQPNIKGTGAGPLLDLTQFEMPVQRQATFASFRNLQQLCNDPKATCWGFMLRSRAPEKTGADSTIIVESRRMNLVRTMIYDRHVQQEADSFGVTRKQLTFVSCLLDQSLRESYLQLYPDQADLQAKAMQELDMLAAQVIITGGKKKDTASWFRTHIGRERPLAGLTREQALDFMLSRDNISVLLQFLQQAGRLP